MLTKPPVTYELCIGVRCPNSMSKPLTPSLAWCLKSASGRFQPGECPIGAFSVSVKTSLMVDLQL